MYPNDKLPSHEIHYYLWAQGFSAPQLYKALHYSYQSHGFFFGVVPVLLLRLSTTPVTYRHL